MQKAYLAHILRLKTRHFHRQVVRVHILITRYKIFVVVAFHYFYKSRPFVTHPYRVEIRLFRAYNEHYFGGIERGENIRLVHFAEFRFERYFRKEYLISLLRKRGIQVLRDNAVYRASSVFVAFFITDKHVETLFFLRYFKDMFLYSVYLFRFRFVNFAGEYVGVFYRRFVIGV